MTREDEDAGSTASVAELVRGDLAEDRDLARHGPHDGDDALAAGYRAALRMTVALRQLLAERRSPAFLVIQTMQERIANRDEEVRRLGDLVDELRKTVETRDRRLDRVQQYYEDQLSEVRANARADWRETAAERDRLAEEVRRLTEELESARGFNRLTNPEGGG